MDVAGGVTLFQQRHPETIDLYDAKHKAACLLKAQLEKNRAGRSSRPLSVKPASRCSRPNWRS